MAKSINREELPKNALAVIVGRFSPVHLGHQRLIQTAIDETDGKVIVVVGSANVLDDRTPFEWTDRVLWIRKVFPNVLVSAINDHIQDIDWEQKLGMVIRRVSDGRDCVFYTGSLDDVSWLSEDALVRVVDSHYLTSNRLSATTVRTLLKSGDHIDNLVPSEIIPDVERAWKEYIKKQSEVFINNR